MIDDLVFETRGCCGEYSTAVIEAGLRRLTVVREEDGTFTLTPTCNFVLDGEIKHRVEKNDAIDFIEEFLTAR